MSLAILAVWPQAVVLPVYKLHTAVHAWQEQSSSTLNIRDSSFLPYIILTAA